MDRAVPIGSLLDREDKRSKITKPQTSKPFSFKLLKACNFCRKRKIKCKVQGNSSVCQSCTQYSRECIFDHKVIENKFKDSEPQKPKRLSASDSPVFSGSKSINLDSSLPKLVLAPPNQQNPPPRPSHTWSSESVGSQAPPPLQPISETSSTVPTTPQESVPSFPKPKASMPELQIENLAAAKPSSYTGTFLEQVEPFAMEQYNKLIQYPASLTGSNDSSIDIPDTSSLKQVYIDYIEPYTPFLPHLMFEEDLSNFATCCINVSSVSSPNYKLPRSAVDSFLTIIHHDLNTNSVEWNVVNLCCFFLLPSRIVMNKRHVYDSLNEFNRLYESSDQVPIQLVVGALCVDAWNSFYTELNLITKPEILEVASKMFNIMNIKHFNYQFITVTTFIYKLIWLQNDATNLPYNQRKDEILKFEYNMLLFPAKLSNDLIVVRDTLLSTPEAFILHILHNMLMIAYYKFAVTKPQVGEMALVFPVPGLYHFIYGMAISNFRVTQQIVGRWSIIADTQIFTAKCLTEMYNVMEFDNFTFALKFYNRRPNSNYNNLQCMAIDEQAQKIADKAHVNRDDDFDGHVVFWVFRDVRSMSLQMYINNS